ncbi:MAG TPA: hypothetical protein DCZ72_14130 [Armatimonadetes bacterium]|nr:hypothetical protein [Armatimonadota bacterium]
MGQTSSRVPGRRPRRRPRQRPAWTAARWAELGARLLLFAALLWLAYAFGFARGVQSVPAVEAHPSSAGDLGSRHAAGEIAAVIWQQPCRRRVREVILHHTWKPTAAQYNGASTVRGILNYHVNSQGWGNMAYHYVIDPRGYVWLGRPLAEDGVHTAGHNRNTVAVCLLLNGDEEKVSAAQQRAAGLVLRTLLERFGLRAEDNFDGEHGFHRDYADKTCPGALISKEQVRGWLTAD